jgi:NADPH:quinone reductase-like Zn-dependent oxidoreductase
MRAIRVHAFGAIDALVEQEVAVPAPGEGEVLIQVRAAGVGPWDALIRSGLSVVEPRLPLTPGSDVAGTVTAVGPGVQGPIAGDRVYGVTNPQFTGGYAEYAVAATGMIAPKPTTLGFVEAASVPVVAITAWQMLFDHGRLRAGQRVLIHGGAGNVGAYAVQLASLHGATVIATASGQDLEYVRGLGADQVIDYCSARFEHQVEDVDLVADAVGGDVTNRSLRVLRPGGILVSAAGRPDQAEASERRVEARFFLVEVTTEGLERLTGLIDAGRLRTRVGEVLPLGEARHAHEMLAGAPHRRGKIVLDIGD